MAAVQISLYQHDPAPQVVEFSNGESGDAHYWVDLRIEGRDNDIELTLFCSSQAQAHELAGKLEEAFKVRPGKGYEKAPAPAPAPAPAQAQVDEAPELPGLPDNLPSGSR